MGHRKQKSCHQCRARHLKCDGEQPCIHCNRGGRECSTISKHVFLNESDSGIVRRKKHYDLSFHGDQTWINVPSVRFANSTSEAAQTGNSNTVTPSRPQVSNVRWSSQCGSLSQEASGYSSIATSTTSNQAGLDFINVDHVPLNDFENALLPYQEILSRSEEPLHFAPNPTRHLSSDPRPLWPFSYYQEALLMQYYIRELAPWFDTVDFSKHFASTIPQLANKSPPLLNAIYALVSKHLFLMGKLNKSISLRYADACYRVLLPNIGEKAYQTDYLATVLILRLIAHMSECDLNLANISYIGQDIFADAWKANRDSSLHIQFFFAALRLYTMTAWTKRQPIAGMEAEDCQDCVWMERAVASLGDEARLHNSKITMYSALCVNYVYRKGPKSWSRWRELSRISEAWSASKPEYFEPIYTQEPTEDDPFPKRLFLNASYACTHQNFSLAHLLLLNNQPEDTLPTFSGAERSLPDQIDHESLILLREIIGTAFSHPDCVVAKLQAVPAINQSGHLLKDRLSQERTMGLLEDARKHCCQSVDSTAVDELRQVWGWEPETLYANVQ